MAIKEDVGSGDVTTNSTIPANLKATAIMKAKAEGVISGLKVAKEVLNTVDKKLKLKFFVKDGAKVKKFDKVLEAKGSARSLLVAERTALNFVQHLSGIATLTNKFTEAAKPTKILDTRKTIPGYRMLEKQAVLHGRGTNHRKGLYDLILIKDNHIKVAGSITNAVKNAKKNNKKGLKIEVEAATLEQVKEALDVGADIIMLDNMTDSELKRAVKLVNKKAKTEASGNMNLERVTKLAKIGLDYISVGAITHSAPALDINFKIVKYE